MIRRKQMPQLRNANTRGHALNRSSGFVLCLLALVGVLFLASCSKSASGNSVQLKSPATGDKEMPLKSGYAFAVTKTFTNTAG
jgi:hypothetical protein